MSKESSLHPAEDQDDTTENHSMLDEFRQKWKQELSSLQTKTVDDEKCMNLSESSSVIDENNGNINTETLARQYFMNGVELEKCGKLYDAIRSYRRAVQIVPDIEFRVFDRSKMKQSNVQTSSSNQNIQDNNNQAMNSISNRMDNLDLDDPEEEDLFSHFQNDVRQSGRVCEQTGNKSTIRTGFHFSDLPIELVLYILRWVVTRDLDTRSLENCAAVCKGFYICARDSEIWKSVCQIVWKSELKSLDVSEFCTWREMFYKRNRVLFNGCYISKASYLRLGENSFQDQFYRPVQLVQYFRYLRFFPDGTMLMLTSAEEPSHCVGLLKSRSFIDRSILKGEYTINDDTVFVRLKNNSGGKTSHTIQTNRRRGSICPSESKDNFFHLDLAIKRNFCQLQWISHKVIDYRGISTDFEITSSRYPNFIYSRVKSYSRESDSPL